MATTPFSARVVFASLIVLFASPRAVVRPTTKPVYIQIRNSPRYCIGDEPQPVVWVEGDAGWYEIQPHADYAAIYEKSCEGIRLYYIIMALYEKAIGKNTTAKQRKRIVANYDLDELFFQVSYLVSLIFSAHD